MEADVIVVGAGAAGIAAAIAASEKGARTIILEKGPNIGWTNTCRAGGSISIAVENRMRKDIYKMSTAEKITEAKELTSGHCNPDLIKTWRENIDSVISWLEKWGIKWTENSSKSPVSRQAEGRGAGLAKQLQNMAEKAGVQIYFNTRAEKLLINSKGELYGIKARTPEGFQEYSAKAVVLATAGFQANHEMLLKYFGPEFTYGAKLTGSPHSTGDGHIMAQEAGAQLINLDQFHTRTIDKSWRPGSTGSPGPVRNLPNLYPYSILVNRTGQRFMDEATTSNTIACSILKQPEATVAMLFDEKIRQLYPEEVKNYKPAKVIMKADSLEELAKIIEVPYSSFLNTMKEFNRAVEKGDSASLPVPKRKFAHKVEIPPFYAIYPMWSGLNCTLGGVKINTEAQVMDRDDNPVPGLYAAGEMIGGFFFGTYKLGPGGEIYYQGNYQVTTSSLSACVVFGRIAGNNAAAHARKEKGSGIRD